MSNADFASQLFPQHTKSGAAALLAATDSLADEHQAAVQWCAQVAQALGLDPTTSVKEAVAVVQALRIGIAPGYDQIFHRSTPGGGHDIYTTFAGREVVLVRVRPVGTLEFANLSSFFVPEWIPALIEALQLAHRIADREKPWEPYEVEVTNG